MRVLMPMPCTDFDPTETGVPWTVLTDAGHEVVFATPRGVVAAADDRMLTGEGLGLFRRFLVAERPGIDAYNQMAASDEFAAPLAFDALGNHTFDAIVLPGGHAPGMKPFLESSDVQSCIVRHANAGAVVAAICHGVLAAARSRDESGRSILEGRRVTALTRRMELTAWRLTKRRLGNYYRTYPETVQEEVTAAVGDAGSFVEGPGGLRGFFEKILPLRDRPGRMARGFVVRDGNLLTARWPGDAHTFAHRVVDMLAEARSAVGETNATGTDGHDDGRRP